MKKIICCICGKRIPVVEGNNPYPVKEWSAIGSTKNRCCHSCNVAGMATTILGTTNSRPLLYRVRVITFNNRDSFPTDTAYNFLHSITPPHNHHQTQSDQQTQQPVLHSPYTLNRK